MLREWMRRNAHHSLSYHRLNTIAVKSSLIYVELEPVLLFRRHLFRNALASYRSLSRFSSSFFFIAQRLARLAH